MARLVPAPKRLAHKLCRWLGIALLITSIASLLLWAYTGRSPVAHLTNVVGSSSTAKLHIIESGSNGLALCLDGTSPAVFVSHNADSHDWIIYLGQDSLYWCLDDEDCLYRSFTPQGSSRGLPVELELHGVLSNSEQINPQFYSWSKAVIHACDGSGFLGHRAAPFHVSNTNKPLYSRGYHVFWRAIEWLRRKYQSTMEPHKARLLFVGQGSSGIALMIAAPAIRKQFPFNRVKFAIEGSVMPDRISSLVERLKQVTTMHQIASNPDLEVCVAEHGHNADQQWRCLLLSGLNDHLSDSDFFFSGSNYDRWLAVQFLGVPCPIRDCRDDEQSFGKYEQLRRALLDALSPVDKKSAKDGIWMSSCWSRSHLVHDQLLTRISVEGWTLSDALRAWYFRDSRKSGNDNKFMHFVDGSHPSNPTCPV